MERDALLAQISAPFSMTKIPTQGDQLEDSFNTSPVFPQVQPTLYFEDATQEVLAIHLARGWPSASLWSDEAKSF